MMYNKKLAVAVKVNGKILREFKDTVYLPFGAEYQILIKNLNSVKVLVNMDIDSTNMLDDGLVIYPGEETTIERSIVNGNLNKGNKFKFIERTGEIEEYRGIKLEDGIIKLAYQFEKAYRYPTPLPYHTYHYYHNPYYNPWWLDNNFSGTSGSTSKWASKSEGESNSNLTRSMSGVGTSQMAAGSTGVWGSSSSAVSAQNSVANDAGITVPGSKSNQKFTTTFSFPLENEKHIMIIKLLGQTYDNEPVVKPVTVKQKIRCETCGLKNKATANFCSRCATSLKVYS